MSTKTAVVIDDEIDLTTYLTTILESDGFIVKSANDAVTGEQLIKDVSPDIILIDLMMPGRTGIQLFSRLRIDEKTKDIPLVMVTGIKEQTGVDWGEIVDRYKTRRPDGFVEKPIDPERLLGVVHGALAGQGGDAGILHG